VHKKKTQHNKYHTELFERLMVHETKELFRLLVLHAGMHLRPEGSSTNPPKSRWLGSVKPLRGVPEIFAVEQAQQPVSVVGITGSEL